MLLGSRWGKVNEGRWGWTKVTMGPEVGVLGGCWPTTEKAGGDCAGGKGCAGWTNWTGCEGWMGRDGCAGWTNWTGCEGWMGGDGCEGWTNWTGREGWIGWMGRDGCVGGIGWTGRVGCAGCGDGWAPTWAQSPGFWPEQLAPTGQAEQAGPLVYNGAPMKLPPERIESWFSGISYSSLFKVLNF
jgi:hypothetical protein